MQTYTDKLFLGLDLSHPTSEFPFLIQEIPGDFFSSAGKGDRDYFPYLKLKFIH